MRPPCAECGKPVLIFRIPRKRGQKRMKVMDKGHDLCRRCWRAQRAREAQKLLPPPPDTWGRNR